MSRASTARAGETSRPARKPAKGYFQRSELPLTSLIFLLPFLVLYEIGFSRYFVADIRAFTWLQGFFQFFGASGRHLPALAVVGILLTWHIARRDAWQVSPRHLILMMFESLGLAVPLILVGMVISRYMPMMNVHQAMRGWVVLSVGAGIYEELVFRLIAFTLLSLLLVDVLKMKRFWAYLLMVLISSLAFSLYHYWGYEQFELKTFVFRTAAGLYFGAVFVFRGFGISAGTHASYDLVVNAVQSLA